MRTSRLRHLLVALTLVLAALTSSCGDDGPSNVERNTDCIGADGGSVAVTDTSSFLYGVSFHVLPNTWEQCWSVYLSYHSTFSTPNFPDGIEGYEGWLTGSMELAIGRESGHDWIDAPDTLGFELTFPRRDMTEESGEKLMAFRFDEQVDLYRLAVPMRMDDQSLTVQGHHYQQLWTWGKVDLEEIDFETYLQPAMEELHGVGAWLEIEAELQRLEEQALADQQAFTCEALAIARTAFATVGEAAADNVRSIQDSLEGRCGVCDATTAHFYDELSDYLRLKMQYYVADLFLGNSRNVLIKIYGLLLCGYLQYSMWQLDCDYECFCDHVSGSFYGQLARYAACLLMVDLIDWAQTSGFIECS